VRFISKFIGLGKRGSTSSVVCEEDGSRKSAPRSAFGGVQPRARVAYLISIRCYQGWLGGLSDEPHQGMEFLDPGEVL
jgi:hypothetical protein